MGRAKTTNRMVSKDYQELRKRERQENRSGYHKQVYVPQMLETEIGGGAHDQHSCQITRAVPRQEETPVLRAVKTEAHSEISGRGIATASTRYFQYAVP